MKKVFLISIYLLLSFLTVVNSQTLGTLTVKFTTTTYKGKYAPKHILAVWLTNSSGSFVKTLNSYSQNTSHRQYLARWKSASNYNVVDATTGATLSSHGQITGNWSSTNIMSAVVPDGTYTVNVEFTESDASGKYATFSFVKGTSTTTSFTSGTTSPYISGISLSWEPISSAVDEVPAGKNYQIFPNPVKDYLNITGKKIKSINVYNFQGSHILTSNENKINFSKFPKGAYVIEIITEEGTFYRRAVKD